MNAPKRFEAYIDCPKCGRLDHHLMREPLTDPVDHRSTLSGPGLWASIGEIAQMIPNPEAQFEVIRICKCGHEFGQI